MAAKPYRPSLVDFAFGFTGPRNRAASPDASIPRPLGWTFDNDHDQLLLQPSPSSFAELMASYGFVSPSGDAQSEDADSPFLATVVGRLFSIRHVAS